MDFSEIIGSWDYRTLPANVKVGQDVFIERKASFDRYRSTRDCGLEIGKHTKIYTWCEFNVEEGGCVTIGDSCALAGAIFMCAEKIAIGDGVQISYHVTIADSDFHPRDTELRIRDAIASSPEGDKSERPPIETRPVTIGDQVTIGIGAMILKGVSVGKGAKILAGAVVTKDVPPGGIVHGNPSQIVEQ